MAIADEQFKAAYRQRQTVAAPLFSGNRSDKVDQLLADRARSRADRDSLLTSDGERRFVFGLSPMDGTAVLL